MAMQLVIRRRPLPSSIFFWGLGILLALGWLPRLLRISDADTLLDIVFAATAISVFLRGWIRRTNLIWFAGVVVYTAIGATLAVVVRGANLYDFLLAYKFCWYVALLFLASARPLLDEASLDRLLSFSLLMFGLIYLGKFATGDGRPTFFTENNFELLLLCLLYFATHVAHGKSKPWHTAALLALSVISGSRSGAALAAVTVLFTFDMSRIRRASTWALLALGAAGAAGAYYVFATRSGAGGLEETDRYRFFLNFLRATEGWGTADYLFGADRISPLPEYICDQLVFYGRLFSYSGDGSCYSVILHSFNLRILYDHGVLVTAALCIAIWRILGPCSFKQKACVVLLLFMNGMSVSSLNSVYAALGILLVASAGAMRLGKAGLPADGLKSSSARVPSYERLAQGPDRR